MKIHREKATIEVTYERLVLDDGFTFRHFSDVFSLMEQLEHVDGYSDDLIIYTISEEELEKLKEIKVVRENSRGAYSQGENYKMFYRDLLNIFFSKHFLEN